MTPVFMIGEVIFEMLIPLLMASIIDKGVEVGNINHIMTTGVKMIILAAGGLACGILGAASGAKAATGFARNLREAMFENIQGFAFSNIDKFSTPSLVTRLTTDVNSIQMAYQMILRMAMRAPASIVVAMFMAFSINSRLSSIYLVAVVVLGACLYFIMTRAYKYFQQAFPKYDKLNESVEENVSGIRAVKAYVREDYETKKFHKASGEIYKLFVRAEGVLSFNSPVMQTTVYSCILLISWMGAKMIVAKDMTTGDMMSLLTYCMNILMSLMMLSMVFVMIVMSRASARRICEILNETSNLTSPENAVTEVKDGSIIFENVDFCYGDNEEELVLRDVNLEIRSGETIGIIGGTGSSKSTLVSLISRLYDTDRGTVKVGGVDVRKYDLEALRNKVSVVLQKNVLFSGSILDNLRWGDENATREECERACRLACADEFIQRFPEGYDTHIEQGGTNVSGGQKQRLCIARALLKKPKIIIFDDSTSAVDTATDAGIRKALSENIPDTTKIIIAQRISSVQDADRIIVMDEGRVMAFDTHERLLETSEIYREVYDSQINGNGDFDEGGDR